MFKPFKLRYLLIPILLLLFFTTESYAMDDDLEGDSRELIKRKTTLTKPKVLVKGERPQQLELVLLPDTNKFALQYRAAFDQEKDPDSCGWLSFKSVTSILGFGAGIPYIEGARRAGASYYSQELGTYFAIAVVVYSGGKAFWTIWELIEASESPQGSLRSRVGKIATSLVLGAVVSVPSVYLAYTYNTVKALAVVNFVYEWIFRSFACYKAISHIPSLCFKCSDCCESNPAKKKALEFVDLSRISFLTYQKELSRPEASNQLVYLYLASQQHQKLLKEDQLVMPSYFARGIPKKSTQYSVLIFPIGAAVVNSILAYKGFSLLIHNVIGLVILSAVSASPTFILEVFTTNRVGGTVFDIIYYKRKKISNYDFMLTFYPKTTIAIVGGAIFIAASSTPGAVYILLDSLGDTLPAPLKITLTTLSSVAMLKFGSYGVAKAALNFAAVIIKKTNAVAGYAYRCIQKLDALQNSLWSATSHMIDGFMESIYPEVELVDEN